MTGPVCHCGKPLHYGFDDDPTHHRGMCEHCDSVRCDAFPGACGFRPGSASEWMRPELLGRPTTISDHLRRNLLLALAQADGQSWTFHQEASGWNDHMAEYMYGADADMVEQISAERIYTAQDLANQREQIAEAIEAMPAAFVKTESGFDEVWKPVTRVVERDRAARIARAFGGDS